LVILEVSPSENPAKDLRVQRFDPTIHHFGKAGVVGDFEGLDPVFVEESSRSAGAVDLDTTLPQSLGKLGQTRFITNADQRSADGGRSAHGSLYEKS
jgi:hypothetical protein